MQTTANNFSGCLQTLSQVMMLAKKMTRKDMSQVAWQTVMLCNGRLDLVARGRSTPNVHCCISTAVIGSCILGLSKSSDSWLADGQNMTSLQTFDNTSINIYKYLTIDR